MEHMRNGRAHGVYCVRAGTHVNFCEDWGCINAASGACDGYNLTNNASRVQIAHRQENVGFQPVRTMYEDARMFARRVA